MRTRNCPFRLAAAFALLLASTPFAARAEEAPAVAPPPAAVAPSGPTDPRELEAFVDGAMAASMAAEHVSAATISVVKDGQLFFAKGYGFADREKRTPVVADRTLFRPGSTSKLFTWTAVMQLVEQGKLDLDADVNQYIKGFQIPATYPEPVTLKHLLTHTAGFEEGALGYLILKDGTGVRPLAESLAAHMPDRVRPPGTWSSYSNWGTALAGLIVEQTSGVPFADYIQQNIFDPLDMKHSSFHEPLPAELEPDMAKGYKWKDGLFEPGFFEFIANFGPAGSLSSTATDMANFMIAHLQLGRFGDRRILKEETARLMHSRLFTADPRLSGMAYGFYESEIAGRKAIGHAGDTIFFHSDLTLFPEQNLGVFVSYGPNGGHSRTDFIEAFVKRYLPAPEVPLPKPPEGFMERGAKVAGSYRFTRHNWSDLEKVAALANVVSVGLKPDGTLVTTGIFETPWNWSEVEPFFYRQIDGGLTLAFKQEADGTISHATISNFPFMPAYRIAWYSAPAFNYLILGGALLLCITTLVSAIRNRKANKLEPPAVRRAVRLAFWTSLVTLIFVIAAVVVVSAAGEDLFYGFPPSLTAVLMLPFLAAALTLGVLLSVPGIWRQGSWTRFRRVHYTLFALFAVGLVWFYWYWNLFGAQYG